VATAAASEAGFQWALPQLIPAAGPWGVWTGLVVAGAFGMWSERTRIGKELSGALVATLAGAQQHAWPFPITGNCNVRAVPPCSVVLCCGKLAGPTQLHVKFSPSQSSARSTQCPMLCCAVLLMVGWASTGQITAAC
jgi:hypothetical protein